MASITIGMYTYGYVYLWVCIPMGTYTYGTYTYGTYTYGTYTYGTYTLDTIEDLCTQIRRVHAVHG